jgi:hypothetical protein
LFHHKPTDLLKPLFLSRATTACARKEFHSNRVTRTYTCRSLFAFPNFAAAMPQRVTIVANVTQATELTKYFPAFIA